MKIIRKSLLALLLGLSLTACGTNRDKIINTGFLNIHTSITYSSLSVFQC